MLESPAWYTAYTPYQPEISQGRLEALLNFQTMVTDLTGLDTANASLLDESTAVAEAVTLMRRRATVESNRVVVDADCLPQTIAVLDDAAGPARDRGRGGGPRAQGLPGGEYFGVVQQYPGCSGAIRDFAAVTAEAHARGALVTVAADLLALTLLTPPGEWGADVAVGSSQRFGVPLWYGGPHAAFMAVKAGLERDLPGRLVGLSRRRRRAGPPTAWRCRRASSTSAARRRRRTSAPRRCCSRWSPPCTPCTTVPRDCAASRAGSTAGRSQLADGLEAAGFALVHREFFDTMVVETPGGAEEIVAGRGRAGQSCCAWSTRTTWVSRAARPRPTTHVAAVLDAFGARPVAGAGARLAQTALPVPLLRRGPILVHPVFSEAPLRDVHAALPAPAVRRATSRSTAA